MRRLVFQDVFVRPENGFVRQILSSMTISASGMHMSGRTGRPAYEPSNKPAKMCGEGAGAQSADLIVQYITKWLN